VAYPPDDAFVSQSVTLTDQGRAVLAGQGRAVLAGQGRAVLAGQGRAVLAGQADWIALRGSTDRWLGGVHLYGPDAAWRWDPATRQLVPHR
jgi:hypothetical protein